MVKLKEENKGIAEKKFLFEEKGMPLASLFNLSIALKTEKVRSGGDLTQSINDSFVCTIQFNADIENSHCKVRNKSVR